MKETKYHIYSNNKCIYYNVPEEEFFALWESLKEEKLSYEKVVFNSKDYSLQGTIY